MCIFKYLFILFIIIQFGPSEKTCNNIKVKINKLIRINADKIKIQAQIF